MALKYLLLAEYNKQIGALKTSKPIKTLHESDHGVRKYMSHKNSQNLLRNKMKEWLTSWSILLINQK